MGLGTSPFLPGHTGARKRSVVILTEDAQGEVSVVSGDDQGRLSGGGDEPH